MLTRFVCLANSKKELGRCIAGIELDNENKPLFLNGRPKWIRPVSIRPHGEVPTIFTERFHLRDILEINIIGLTPEGFQSENVLFNQNSLFKEGRFDKSELEELCEEREFIFSSQNASLSEDEIKNLDHSLMLIKSTSFKVTASDFEGKHKLRLVFLYNGVNYDFPITDPVSIEKYVNSPQFFSEVREVLLCLSIGIKFETTNRFYKLVAGIIY